jgi:hypothetical protein
MRANKLNLSIHHPDEIVPRLTSTGYGRIYRRGISEVLATMLKLDDKVFSMVNFQTSSRLCHGEGRQILERMPDGFSEVHQSHDGIYYARVWAGMAPFDNTQQTVIDERFIIDNTLASNPIRVAALGIWKYLIS